MGWFLKYWQGLWTSTETLLLREELKRTQETCLVLEDENETLRKDLRAAVNNLLSEAGVAPLPGNGTIKPPERKLAHRHLTWQQKQRLYAHQTKPLTPVAKEND